MNIMKYMTFKLSLIICAVAIVSLSDANGQLIPLENRPLTGSADFQDVGRHVGQRALGTITLTTPTPADGEVDQPSHDIRIEADGFAFLSNGLVLRNSSGGELLFNAPGQSHDLDVLFLGSGAYSVDNFSLPSSNEYIDGGDNVVTAFGGYWNWQADYNRIDGTTATFSLDDQRFDNGNSTDGEIGFSGGISPIDLSFTSGPETTAAFNRVSSARPTPLPVVPDQDGRFDFIEDQTPTIERQNVLLSVDTPPVSPPVVDGDPSEQPPQPVLDLSGITISAEGVSLQDRRLSFDHPDLTFISSSLPPTISAGRVLKGEVGETVDLSRSDNVTVRTLGDDDERTRIQLSGGSDVTSSGGRLTATFSEVTDFNSADDTATVNFSANFTNIDRSVTGTFSETIDLGNRISSLEMLDDENVQDELDIRYTYGVVENNSLLSNDVNYFILDGESAAGVEVSSRNVWREFSRNAHTDIRTSNSFQLDGSNNQTVGFSTADGNVFAEGLAGEVPTANTTFQASRKNVQTSITNFTDGGELAEDDTITISNDRIGSLTELQAETFVEFSREGSTKWTLPELSGFDGSLAAGESLTLTATFDDSSLSESSLGRNYRTRLTARLQDGVSNLFSETDPVAELARVESARFDSNNSHFSIIGSDATLQTVSYFVERNEELTNSSGSASIGAGASLFGEGINLTNTLENSSLGETPTEFRVIDSDILSSNALVEVSFSSLDDASMEQADAFGFETLVSDIAQLNGLDGVLHVVDLSVATGSGGNEVFWFDEDRGNWLNAVLGNSNVETFGDAALNLNSFISVAGLSTTIGDYLDDNRFSGSYESYLDSIDGTGPELGAFGTDGVRAWAVIDHNSFFAVANAVPEPSTVTLIGFLAIGLMTRRKR